MPYNINNSSAAELRRLVSKINLKRREKAVVGAVGIPLS